MRECVGDLTRVSALWLDKRHPHRVQALEALRVSTGLTARQVEIAVENCFSELTEEKILAYLQTYSTLSTSAPRRIWHVLPANAFTSWIHGATLTLLAGHECLLKPSNREPVMARAWAESVKLVSPALANSIQLLEGRRVPTPAPGLAVAYGNDETLSAIRFLLPPGVNWVGYGHQLSVAVIFEEGHRKAESGWTNRLLSDTLPFDLKGCLSPQILYVEKGTPFSLDEIKRELRVVPQVRTFSGWEELGKEMNQFSPHLSCVGVLGTASQEAVVRKESMSWGASRVCALGQMQRPPLSWRNGGIDLFQMLNGHEQIK